MKPSKLRVQCVSRLICKVVALLKAYGADVNARDDEDETLLHIFIAQDLDDCVQLLLTHSPNLNAMSGCGDKPLAKALMWGKEKLAILFLEAGADPNIGIADLKPILIAVGGDTSPEIIMKLIEAGADVNAQDDDGETALHKAVGRHKNSREVTRLLLDAGADPDIQNVYGYSASDYALMTAINSKAMEVSARWKEHVKPSEYPIIPFNEDHAAVICASGDGDIKALQTEFLDQIPDRILTLALLASCHSSQLECCRLLLGKGVDPNARGIYGHTPLSIGANLLDVELAALLIARGAAVDETDSKNGTGPLCIACQSWKGDHPSDSAEQRLKMAGLLLEHGADVNRRDCGGQTPLRQAVIAVCDIELVRLLLSHGARTDIKDGDGLTALQLAEEYGSKAMVTLLKEYSFSACTQDGGQYD